MLRNRLRAHVLGKCKLTPSQVSATSNRGPTRTHVLVAGGPAIETVTDGTCPPPKQDQRGVRRSLDGNNNGAAICDTGSFERR